MRLLFAILMLAALLVMPAPAAAQTCVPNPLANLPDPGRFVMINPCVDAVGTVAMGDIPRPYGAWRVTLKLEPETLWLLPPGVERDDGLIWVKLYPLVYPVRVPVEGERVRLTGALVLDPDWGWRTIAPVWSVTVLAPATPTAESEAIGARFTPAGPVSVYPSGVALDDAVIYTVVVVNNTDQEVQGLQLSGAVPAGTAFAGAMATVEGARFEGLVGGVVVWSLGALPPRGVAGPFIYQVGRGAGPGSGARALVTWAAADGKKGSAAASGDTLDLTDGGG